MVRPKTHPPFDFPQWQRERSSALDAPHRSSAQHTPRDTASHRNSQFHAPLLRAHAHTTRGGARAQSRSLSIRVSIIGQPGIKRPTCWPEHRERPNTSVMGTPRLGYPQQTRVCPSSVYPQVRPGLAAPITATNPQVAKHTPHVFKLKGGQGGRSQREHAQAGLSPKWHTGVCFWVPPYVFN